MMSNPSLQGRGKDVSCGGGPPEITSSGRGGSCFGPGTGRLGIPKPSTLQPRQRFEGDIPELHGKPTNWSVTSQRIYILKPPNTLQVMWPLNANTVGIFVVLLKQGHVQPCRHPTARRLLHNSVSLKQQPWGVEKWRRLLSTH